MSGDERPDGGQVGVVDEELGLLDRFVELKQRQWFLLTGSALVLLVLPFLMIDGLSVLSELLTGTDDFAGYAGLPSLVLVFAIVVIGFDLLLGYTRLLSFGHAAFFGAAAYGAAIFSEQVVASPLAMVVVGGLVGTLLALPIGVLSIRRSGVYFAVLTLTFAQMLFFWARSPGAWLTRGSNGFIPDAELTILGYRPDTPLTEALLVPLPETVFGTVTVEYVLVAVFALLAILMAYRIVNSPYGLVLEAVGQNQQRVNFVGLNVFRYKLMAFVISGAFAAVGGALFAIHEIAVGGGVYPDSLYWIQSGDFVIMTVLGGVGSIAGPVIGAFVFEYIANVINGASTVLFTGPLQPVLGEFTLNFTPIWRLVLGGVFVLVVAFFPDGVRGALASLARRLSDRFGERRREPATADGGDD